MSTSNARGQDNPAGPGMDRGGPARRTDVPPVSSGQHWNLVNITSFRIFIFKFSFWNFIFNFQILILIFKFSFLILKF